MIRLVLAEILPVAWCVATGTMYVREANKNGAAALGGPKDEEQP